MDCSLATVDRNKGTRTGDQGKTGICADSCPRNQSHWLTDRHVNIYSLNHFDDIPSHRAAAAGTEARADKSVPMNGTPFHNFHLSRGNPKWVQPSSHRVRREFEWRWKIGQSSKRIQRLWAVEHRVRSAVETQNWRSRMEIEMKI